MKAMATEATEPEVKTEVTESRKRRSPVYVVPAPLAYQYPASTFPLYSSPSLLAAPAVSKAEVKSAATPSTEDLLEPAGAPITQIRPVFLQKPYFYAAPNPLILQQKSAVADDTAGVFPVTPLGATVAQDPLPEKDFPIFPYDPEQDKPAAVAF
jgi:hypothetical protein